MENKTPLRTPFSVLPETVGVVDQSTLYRRMFKSLGLGTTSALYHFWQAIQSSARRQNSENGKFKVPEDLPQFGATAPEDDLHRGFEVEVIEEDPDGEINLCALNLGKLILGDQSIAAFDSDGMNVLIAVREDSCVVVYNIRDLIAIYLCSEMRLQFANAVAVPVGNKTTLANAQAGTQSALAALLGLGYMIIPGSVHGETYITVTSRAGVTASLTVQHMTGLVGTLMKSDPYYLADPEWVFAQIKKQDFATKEN